MCLIDTVFTCAVKPHLPWKWVWNHRPSCVLWTDVKPILPLGLFQQLQCEVQPSTARPPAGDASVCSWVCFQAFQSTQSALPAQGLFFIQLWILWKICCSLLCKKLDQIGLFTFCISTTWCSFLTICTYSAKKHQGEEEKSDVPCRKRKVLHLVSQWIALYKDWLHEDEHSKMFLKVFLQFQVFLCWVTDFIFIYMIQKNLIFSHSGFVCQIQWKYKFILTSMPGILYIRRKLF